MSDRYNSLGSLKRHLQRDIDYRIIRRHRHSWATVISPHGGFIECGTSAIAEAIAADTYNFFDFQGLISRKSRHLHITSTRFRHSGLTGMLKRSMVAVSVHSMGICGHTDIWMGGKNPFLKEVIARCLQQQGFTVEMNPPRWQGNSMRNIVNRARYQGVQLELSAELISLLFASSRFYSPSSRPLRTTARFHDLVTAIREALVLYREDVNRGLWDE